MTTRRKFGLGIAAIIAAQRAPAALVRSLVAGRQIAATGTRLPYDAEVEYLESTGTQYIDTGLKTYTTSTSADLKFVRYKGRLSPTAVPSDRYLHGNNNWGFWGVNSSRKWVYRTGGYGSWVVGGIYDIEVEFGSAGYMKIDGTILTSAANVGGVANYYGIGLFCIGNSGGTVTGSFAGSWRIYRMEVVSMGERRDFIPVRFTNEYGTSEGALFDRANPTVGMNPDGSPRTDGLYRNRGTDAFVTGSVKARGASGQNGGGV